MADRQDALLLVQLAQWGTSMGIEDAMLGILADDFDPETASAMDGRVARVLLWGESVGCLTKFGLLDTDLVHDWFWAEGTWERVGPAALKQREKYGSPEIWANFEALAANRGA
jgi:hypothetical protein